MRVTAMSPEQIMDQWEALRTVKNLMGKYVNCRLLNRVEDLWPLFWSCAVFKDAGDDPDLTDGSKVWAEVSAGESAGPAGEPV